MSKVSKASPFRLSCILVHEVQPILESRICLGKEAVAWRGGPSASADVSIAWDAKLGHPPLKWGRVMNLRTLFAAFAVTVLCGSPLLAADSESGSPAIEVWKSATCECCGNWVKHLEANGFAVRVMAADTGTLVPSQATAWHHGQACRLPYHQD